MRRMSFVNTWLTLPTTKWDNPSLNIVDTDNEHCISWVSIFVAESLTLKTDEPDGIELGKKKENEESTFTICISCGVCYTSTKHVAKIVFHFESTLKTEVMFGYDLLAIGSNRTE